MEMQNKNKKNKNKNRQKKEKQELQSKSQNQKGLDEENMAQQLQEKDIQNKNEKFSDEDDDDDDGNEELAIDLSKLKKDQPQTTMEVEGEDQEDEEEKKDKIEEEDYELVNVDFNFYDPSEKQYHSIKFMINGLLDGDSFNSTNLADTIVKQVQIGTMVGVDEGEEEQKKNDQNILGFVTMLSLKTYEKEKWRQEIIDFVLEKSKKFNSSHADFQNILSNPKFHIGLFLNERIMNLSPYIVPTLHDQLRLDLEWLMKEHPDEAEVYKFDYLLVLTKVYKQLQNSKQKKQKQSSGYTSLKDYIFSKFEDFCFLEQAEQYFVFEAKTIRSESGITNLDKETQEQTCYRAVYLIKLSSYLNQVPQIQQYLMPMQEVQKQFQKQK